MPRGYSSLWFAALIACSAFSLVAHMPIGNTSRRPALLQFKTFSLSASSMNRSSSSTSFCIPAQFKRLSFGWTMSTTCGVAQDAKKSDVNIIDCHTWASPNGKSAACMCSKRYPWTQKIPSQKSGLTSCLTGFSTGHFFIEGESWQLQPPDLTT